jgi:hypothetical protein
MKSHLPLNKNNNNNNNYFDSKIFNNNTFFLPGIEKNYFCNNFVNKTFNCNINSLFNNELNNNQINFGIFNNFNSGSCFNFNKNLFNNNIEIVQKMPNYNNLRMNDNELLSSDNYNINYINNSITKARFITIKNGEKYKYDSNKECGLFNLEQFKNCVFNKCELKIENPISFCIIVTDILNL